MSIFLPLRSSRSIRSLCIVVALGLVGGAPTARAQDTGVAGPVFTISTENTGDHVQTEIVSAFADRLQEAWGGRITVRHAHSGDLFRDRDVVEAMARGQVDMAVPGTWQLDRYEPSVAIYMLPMFYGRDRAAVDRLRDGPIGRTVSDRLAAATNTVVLGRWIDLGFAHLFSTAETIAGPGDLAGDIVRIPGGLAHQERLSVLGMAPITVPWGDVRAALSEGEIAGLMSTFESVDSAGLQAYGIRSAYADRQYFAQYVPLVSKRFWNRLSEADRETLVAVWEAGVEAARTAAEQAQEEARQRLQANGVSITQASQDVLDTQRQRLLAAQPGIATELSIPLDLVAEAATRLEADDG